RPFRPLPLIAERSSRFSAAGRRTAGERRWAPVRGTAVPGLELCEDGGAEGVAVAVGGSEGRDWTVAPTAVALAAVAPAEGASVSPSAAMTARTVPTSTVSPAGTRISFSTPLPGD